jgi:hypothetical protein
MNDIAPVASDALSALKRYSAGEITRRELGDCLGEPVSFGETLMLLHQHGLPLPRYGRSFNPKGALALREALRNVKRG